MVRLDLRNQFVDIEVVINLVKPVFKVTYLLLIFIYDASVLEFQVRTLILVRSN